MTVADGDCYKVAGLACFDHGLRKDDSFRVVHGDVDGQGDLSGVRFGHAWIEVGDVVFDASNGKATVMRSEQYYEIGGIQTPTKYTREEAIGNMSRTKTFGPWLDAKGKT